MSVNSSFCSFGSCSKASKLCFGSVLRRWSSAAIRSSACSHGRVWCTAPSSDLTGGDCWDSTGQEGAWGLPCLGCRKKMLGVTLAEGRGYREG